MANTSKETPNYGLPQWEGNDLTDWFELNPAFEIIDTQMKNNANSAQTAQETANGNATSIGNLTQVVNNHTNQIGAFDTRLTADEATIALHTTHLNEHDTSIATINQEIAALQTSTGDTSGEVAALQADVSTLQQQMTVAQQDISDNTDHIGNLSMLETTAKGNLVAAINEIVGGSTPTGDGIKYVGIAERHLDKKQTLDGSGSYYLANPGGNIVAYSFRTQNDFTRVKAQNTDGKAIIIGGYVTMSIYYESNPANIANQNAGSLKVPFKRDTTNPDLWVANLDGANGACYVSTSPTSGQKPFVDVRDAYVYVIQETDEQAQIDIWGQWETDPVGIPVSRFNV